MHVVRCESPQAFLGRAEAFLLADEACHNLLLGVPVILPGSATEGTRRVRGGADETHIPAIRAVHHPLV